MPAGVRTRVQQQHGTSRFIKCFVSTWLTVLLLHHHYLRRRWWKGCREVACHLAVPDSAAVTARSAGDVQQCKALTWQVRTGPVSSRRSVHLAIRPP